MFVWAKINSNKSSKELIHYLLYEKNIFVAPGFIFGKNGEGYVRFSLYLDEQFIIKAKSRLNENWNNRTRINGWVILL